MGKKKKKGHGVYSVNLWPEAQNQEPPLPWAALGESQNLGPAHVGPYHVVQYVVVVFSAMESLRYAGVSFSDLSTNTGPTLISTLIYFKTSHTGGE